MPSKEISFNASFAGEPVPVKLSPMLGEHNWHVYIANYYCGSFNLMSDGWHFYTNERTAMEGYTAADGDILLDMILERLAQ